MELVKNVFKHSYGAIEIVSKHNVLTRRQNWLPEIISEVYDWTKNSGQKEFYEETKKKKEKSIVVKQIHSALQSDSQKYIKTRNLFKLSIL